MSCSKRDAMPQSRSSAPPRELRRALGHEGAHPFGIVGCEACFALHLAFEIELRIEIIAPGFIERALDQSEAGGRGSCEMRTEPMRFVHQFTVRQGPPDQAPAFRLLCRQDPPAFASIDASAMSRPS